MNDRELSALDLENLSVDYGSTRIIDQLNLSVAEGETVAVIGPSGSGKSTLLRAIAGLEPVAGGSIHLGGADVASVPTHARDLGFMFQDHALFPHLDVASNVGFGLEMRGWSKHEQRARVAELLELVGLASYGGRAIDQLSGGEAQRVALARALAPSPRLLMLDEPLGSLDRVLRDQLIIELAAITSELSVTTLHVTHDQAEAFALADRVVVLRDGAIEQVGSPADLWQRPASRFVAEFVGHSNIWTIDGRTVVVPETAVHMVPDGGDPDSVDSDSVDTHSGDTEPATIESRAFAAGRYRLIATLDDGRTVTFASSEAASVGQRVALTIDRGAAIPIR